ncbi:hypothetical protein [Daejeonella sp.]|uniref:hypothetical protein n=1 Tax=Daejeonella sp. TaxID=2805397 RepID=UPI0030BD81F2
MKKLSVYLLIVILSFVYTYDSVQALAHALGRDSSFAWMKTMECEKGAESEESKGQKEKLDFLDHYFSHTQLSLAQIGTISLDSHHAINFSSTDHSLTIYSPPESHA